MLKWTGDWSGVSSSFQEPLFFVSSGEWGLWCFHPRNLGHSVSFQPWPYYMSDPRENVKIDIRSALGETYIILLEIGYFVLEQS